MPPCGGVPYLSASSRKPNLRFCFFRTDAEQIEHGRLHFGAMDTHRAAADFRTVQHHVVALAHGIRRIGAQCRRISDRAAR